MAIVSRTTTVYRDDKGFEHTIEEMKSSHIINVIRHHTDQRAALTLLPASLSNHLGAWIDQLSATINALATELDSRDPHKEEEEDLDD